MIYTVALLAAFGVYLGWFYWRRNQQIQAAGGAQQYHDQLLKKQFGLADGERVLRSYRGQMYLGALRPDQGPGTVETVAFAAVGGSFRGSMLSFALTDRGRLAVAREMNDQEGLMDQAARLRGESSGQVPFRMWGPTPKPRVMTGEEAFASHPSVASQITDGRGRSVLHIEAPEGPLTVWIDIAGVQDVRQWSAT